MKFIKVDDCKNCPFCGVGESFIFGADENFCMANENKDIPLNEDGELKGSPDWCPLDTDEICVSKADFEKEMFNKQLKAK